jgi:stearoyl-CoA desaturase (delta-9 desaturase)
VSAPTLDGVPTPARPTRPARPDANLPPDALGAEKGAVEQVALYVFVLVPFLALAAAVPAVWGWGLSWTDVTLAALFYVVTGLGITVGSHRYVTHGSFRTGKALPIALAVAGCRAVQGPVVQWVADHRRHHAFSDREGDPHSPWRYGDDTRTLLTGMFHARADSRVTRGSPPRGTMAA